MVENQHVQFWIENAVLHCIYKKNCIITLEAAKVVIALRLQLQEGKSYPCICYVLDGSSVFMPEARKYLAKHGNEGIDKLALITTSSVKAVIANLYIAIDKPNKPARLFTNRENALKWLELA